MKTGFALPNIGPVATAEAVIKVAQRAEALAYDSLWTIERLLWPVKPQTPYPVSPDGMLPEQYKYILDPLDTLTFAAAHTKTITLGTSVLDIPYHNPVTGAPADHNRHSFPWPPARGAWLGLVQGRNGRDWRGHEAARRDGG
jgi:alkanesulfonate monooxygenase SsuD/methylene tetrahydromethanopterin reductase-like flavin-dependent oxidoreductase (luciferase family)